VPKKDGGRKLDPAEALVLSCGPVCHQGTGEQTGMEEIHLFPAGIMKG